MSDKNTPSRVAEVRDCFSCRFSPPWRGHGSPAGCSLLTMDEASDQWLRDFCDAAGVNDLERPDPGWPRLANALDCPGWARR